MRYWITWTSAVMQCVFFWMQVGVYVCLLLLCVVSHSFLLWFPLCLQGQDWESHTHSLTYTHMKEHMEEIDAWDCYRNCLLKVSTEMYACLTIPLEWHLNQNNELGSLSVAFYFSVWFFLSSSLFHLLSFAVPSHTLLALLPRVMGGEIGVTVGICSPALHDGTQKHTSAETHTSTGALQPVCNTKALEKSRRNAFKHSR